METRHFHNDEHGEGVESYVVFLSMLLYNGLLGIFAAIAFTYGDMVTAIVLAFTGLLVFLGLILQMLVGIHRHLRLFYGLTGALVFFYVVARGGADGSSLFGPLGLVFGLVVVLGWRLAAWFLTAMALALAMIFHRNLYLDIGQPFAVIVELKFFVAFMGLALFALGYGYLLETRLTGLQNYSRTMAHLAYKDAMTNLANRRSMEDALKQRWEEYRRQDQPFAVVLCNIDNLKELNSQYGQGFGDGVILRIANVLVNGLRSPDIVARWGGDEFLVLLPGQSAQTALKVAERLRSRIQNVELVMNGKPVAVTASLGVAATENALGPQDLVSMAEVGLYQAKKTGKNRVMVG